VTVCDPGIGEGVGERALGELRVTSRPWEAPDVGDTSDAGAFQHAQELVDATRGMSDGEHRHGASLGSLSRG
jgi:hypothetical protein